MFILASKSQRRIEILSKYFDFKNISYEINENMKNFKTQSSLVMSLAFEKGIKVSVDYPNDTVLSFDTIVCCDDKVLGKPIDREDAFNMLRLLSGRKHRVLTGYGIFNLEKGIKFLNYNETLVYFKNLSDEDINIYLDTKEYVDKAGAYGIQDKGSLLVDYIVGDYFNVVGLPISKLYDDLKKLDLW